MPGPVQGIHVLRRPWQERSWMAGTSPAMTMWQELGHALLYNRVVEILPFGVVPEDQPDLPRPGPMLDIVLALDGRLNVVIALEIDEQFDAVSLGEARHQSFTMLIDATHEIARHTDVQNAVWRTR